MSVIQTIKDSSHRRDAETQRGKDIAFSSPRLRVSAVKGVALVVLFIAGCSSPGDLVLQQPGDAPMKTTKVTEAGDYGLFVAGDSQPLLEFPLKVGDPIGFEKINDGAVIWLYGISGNVRNRLQVDKTYEWRRL